MKGSARTNDGHTKGAYLYQKPSYMQGGKAYKGAQGADGSVGLSGDDMESDASVTGTRGSQRFKTGWGRTDQAWRHLGGRAWEWAQLRFFLPTEPLLARPEWGVTDRYGA